MSMQWLFDNSVVLGSTTQRVINQQQTRSGRIYSTEYPTAQPFTFTVTPHNYLLWPTTTARNVLQSIINTDRDVETIINFNTSANNNNPYADLSWWSQYNGDLNAEQLSNLRISAVGTKSFTVTDIDGNVTPDVTAIFRAGDVIQPAGHRYPYLVTQDVIAGPTSVVVPLHRAIIGTIPLEPMPAINTGTQITIPVLATNFPKYRFTPMQGGGFIEWSEPWSFIENITG